jgi:hypothetical protein
VSKFKVGQKVVIIGSIGTRHRGREATVISVKPSMHTPPGVTSLDKYVVQFDGGGQATFLEIQLMNAPYGDDRP